MLTSATCCHALHFAHGKKNDFFHEFKFPVSFPFNFFNLPDKKLSLKIKFKKYSFFNSLYLALITF